jgi:hypothetical protein
MSAVLAAELRRLGLDWVVEPVSRPDSGPLCWVVVGPCRLLVSGPDAAAGLFGIGGDGSGLADSACAVLVDCCVGFALPSPELAGSGL